jgi:uncharacterized protein (DUF736 family)
VAQIGRFKKEGDEFHGNIVTLSVQHNGVRILPLGNPDGALAPTHRVFAGDAELGAAWRKLNKQGHSYYVLQLDDPSFAKAIEARLVRIDGEWVLIWERGVRS